MSVLPLISKGSEQSNIILSAKTPTRIEYMPEGVSDGICTS